MPPDISEEVERAKLAEPVEVVQHHRGVRHPLEAEERAELLPEPLRVGQDLVPILERPFRSLAAGVPNEAGACPQEDDGSVPGPLEVNEPHDRDEVSDLERRGRGVEPRVDGVHLGGERLLRPLRRVVEEAPPAELVEGRAGGHGL